MSRLIAIGDVHGMAVALRQLLLKVNPTASDQVIFLGDYIDRGPDSRGVIEQLLEYASRFPCVFLQGNHEEMLLAAVEGKSEYKFWLKFGGNTTLQSYGASVPETVFHPCPLQEYFPEEHLMFFRGLRDYYECEGFIFVHAGCEPELPMVRQLSPALRWVVPSDTLRHRSGKLVVCGHTPRAKPVRRAGIWFVDTGAGVLHRGQLSAVEVHSGTVWSVPAFLS